MSTYNRIHALVFPNGVKRYGHIQRNRDHIEALRKANAKIDKLLKEK